MTPDELEEIKRRADTGEFSMTTADDRVALLLYVDDLYNGLCWIRWQAALHYLGGAFEPVHMQAIANTAGDLLAGRVMPDYASVIETAQEKATEWAERYAALVDTGESDES